MLDVHPPHHPTNTWRDFFIHIATIVVGLLIAVGLEQAVERIHQRYELRETREALEGEYISNRAHFELGSKEWLLTLARLRNNLLVLEFVRDHPGTPQTQLPGDLRWRSMPGGGDKAVWDAAEKTGVTRLMPLKEANRHAEFYGLLVILGQQGLEEWNALNDAHRFDLIDPDPTHLLPPQLEEVIRLTDIAIEKHIQVGYSMGRLAYEFPEMPQIITWDRMTRLRPTPLDLDPQGMANAHKLSDERLQTAIP
jgi:hypothetical protein